MTSEIGTPTKALRALRALSHATSNVARASERLASGLRLNRPADDAVALQIATSLQADSKILAQGVRNASDALSLLDIASNALESLADVALRQRELAAQAANGALTSVQRHALNQEMDALVDEYNRITASVSFNGEKLFRSGTITVHAGWQRQNELSLDVASALLRNVGGGTFQAAIASSVGAGIAPNAIATGDFDHDGKMDAAVTSETGSGLTVLLGNGDGTFKAPVGYATTAAPISVAAADFNKDGHLDLVTLDYGQGIGQAASVFFGNGDGTFQTAVAVPTGTGPLALGVGDIDSDGTPDIVTAPPSNNFFSGVAEITQAVLPGATRETTQFNFSGASVREQSSITARGIAGTAEVTRIATASGALTPNGSYFFIDSPSDQYYVWFNKNGGGIDPLVAGRTGVEVTITGAMTAAQVASALSTALDALPDFSTGVSGGNLVTVTNAAVGATADAFDVNVGNGFSITKLTEGVNAVASGSYFLLYSTTTPYYVWYNVDGAGGDPGFGGWTGIQVDVNGTDSAAQVATKTAAAVNALADFSASAGGVSVTVVNELGGAATDASAGSLAGEFSVGPSVQGSTLIDQSQYLTFSSPTGSYYVWFDIAAGGIDPSVPGATGIRVSLDWDDSADTVASAVAAAVDALGAFSASSAGGAAYITASSFGSPLAPPTTGNSGGTSVSIFSPGQYVPITSGQYFLLSSANLTGPNTGYYVWYNVDGGGGNPAIAGLTGVQVNINSTMTSTQVANATRAAINPLAYLNASSAGDTVTITAGNGAVTDASNGDIGGGFTVSVVQQGTESRVDPVTDTILSPEHGYVTGQKVRLLTSGTLPSGLNTSTDYYVIVLSTDVVKLATSLANAIAGTAVNFTSYGSGGHSISDGITSAGARVAFSNGDGTFTDGAITLTGPRPNSLIFPDLNVDGHPDLVLAEELNGNIEIGFGSGDGTFATPIEYAAGSGIRSVQLADFDRDGNYDLAGAAYASGAGSTVSILYGRDGATFESFRSYSAGAGAYALAVGDINGDGLPDMVTANYAGGAGTTATVMLSNGDRTFNTSSSPSVGPAPSSLAIADFNGDSAPDLIFSNLSAATVSVALAITKSVSTMAYLNISGIEAARQSLGATVERLEMLHRQLATIGSAQSRLMTMMDGLRTTSINYVDAASRLSDADIAEEHASLVRGLIKQQAATAVLAQANLEPPIRIDGVSLGSATGTGRRGGSARA